MKKKKQINPFQPYFEYFKDSIPNFENLNEWEKEAKIKLIAEVMALTNTPMEIMKQYGIVIFNYALQIAVNYAEAEINYCNPFDPESGQYASVDEKSILDQKI